MTEFISKVKIPEEYLDLSEYRDVVELYLKLYSAQKTNFLYLNIIHPRYQTLIYTNAKNIGSNKELVKPNNPSVIYRQLKILNQTNWKKLYKFFTIINGIINLDISVISSNVYVFELNNLLSFLNQIDYNLKNAVLIKNIFGSIFGYCKDTPDKKKKLSYIEGNIFTYQKINSFFVQNSYSRRKSTYTRFCEFDYVLPESMGIKTEKLSENSIPIPIQGIDDEEIYLEIPGLKGKKEKFKIKLFKNVLTINKNILNKYKDEKIKYGLVVNQHESKEFYQIYMFFKSPNESLYSGLPNIKYFKGIKEDYCDE